MRLLLHFLLLMLTVVITALAKRRTERSDKRLLAQERKFILGSGFHSSIDSEEYGSSRYNYNCIWQSVT